jgi:hypothetical protein
MKDDNIIRVNFKQEHLAENELVQQIKDLIYSHEGTMSIASAFGCIEVAKHDLAVELLK